jgi:hypothetical protein
MSWSGHEADQVAAFGTIPGGVYTLLEKFVLRSNTAVMGARYAHYTLAG